MAFECPICKNPTQSLVIPLNGKLSGKCCVEMSPSKKNVNLGQALEKWTHVDKNGVEHKHKLTVGKSWEIDNRVTSKDDGVTVVNRATGKEAQY